MDRAEYWIVDAGGDVDEDEHDSKISCTELTILRRLSKKDFFLFALAYMCDHPLLEWSSRVQMESGIARNGYAVVRGKDPVAKGNCGDILALAKENADGTKIIQIGITAVDGKSVKPDVWYDIDLQRRRLVAKNQCA